MLRTKTIEDQLRKGRLEAKTLDSMFRRLHAPYLMDLVRNADSALPLTAFFAGCANWRGFCGLCQGSKVGNWRCDAWLCRGEKTLVQDFPSPFPGIGRFPIRLSGRG